jgi:S1-C subfamily serine protease
MRLPWFAALAVAAAACGPKVDPASPLDVDDPRAWASAPVDAGPPTPDAGPPPRGLRATTVSRAELDRVLDAGPGELLRGIEVAAVRPDGSFAGWQLVRLLGDGRRFAVLDLAAGDVIASVNGRTLESPPDLAALWAELRTAAAIELAVRRGDHTFSIRAEITTATTTPPSPSPAPSAPPAGR